jgi:predicted lipoprotein with Yx(FWY)xxD motif
VATVAATTIGPAQASSGASAKLTVKSSAYGKTLFGPSGKALYVFTADKGSTSKCYGSCAKAWPPLLTKGEPVAGKGVQAKLLGTTKRKGGALQVTYGGHPVYYYVDDTAKEIMCQNADMHGGIWYVVKPNGKPNLAKSKMHMKM